ncbi:hypothetical protein INR49_023218 [Caranx melampygus]|nr:hypothetical protein INR49_023218 [Caranx melampygus]
MLQCSVGKEYQRLKDSEVQQRQKLEAANHRIAELENQLAKKDQLILDQKKLMEDTKAQSRAELSACESRCVALRRVTESTDRDASPVQSDPPGHAHTQQLPSRRLQQDKWWKCGLTCCSDQRQAHPSSSSVGIINGAVEALSPPPCTSPPAPPPLSPSPPSTLPWPSAPSGTASATAVWTDRSRPEAEGPGRGRSHTTAGGGGRGGGGSARESPLGQEVEEAALLSGSPQTESQSPPPGNLSLPLQALPPQARPPADLTLAVRRRRHELSIMDYDEMLPEY